MSVPVIILQQILIYACVPLTTTSDQNAKNRTRKKKVTIGWKNRAGMEPKQCAVSLNKSARNDTLERITHTNSSSMT